MHIVSYEISMAPEKGITAFIQVKPRSRLSEANITTLIRQTIAKIQDME